MGRNANASRGSRFQISPAFVDDTGLAGIRTEIRSIINRSILAAYLIFGFPDESDSAPVINADVPSAAM